MSDDPNPTLAEFIVSSFRRRGVKRMFGIPGGGSSLDIIDAAARAGVDFVLTQTETAAALMASVTAELSGAPGVVLTGIGPGAASAVNGIAYASLEKVPVALLTDCGDPERSLHQVFDQRALFRPLVKSGCRLRPDCAANFEALLDEALAPPYGPVHIDLTAADAGTKVPVPCPSRQVEHKQPMSDTAAACALLRTSRKPVIIAGLDARCEAGAATVRKLAGRLGAPVLCTYKAKGVVPDGDPHLIGMFTGAAAEAACIGESDLIILFGVDPVEVIPGPWRYDATVLEFAQVAGHRLPVEPAVKLCGPFADMVATVEEFLAPGDWTAQDLTGFKRRMSQDLALPGAAVTAETVTRAVQRAAPPATRLSVDSGAHMFAAMTVWQASQPFDVLKSNGLSTMGFALPAAIASVLEQPDVPVAALTGDGGLTMCLGELATAARVGGKIVCVVLNDARLSLIDIKQQRQQRPSIGVRYPRIDFAAGARGLGCRGWRVERQDELDNAFTEAFACPGPAVVDVTVDPSGYGAQLEALRG